jgi:tetrachloro-p-hydroquinone reductive dehalogenase
MAISRLYHAVSSYYSMIAHLALAIAGIDYSSRVMDIHRRREQLTPEYGAINPHMTVPALVTETSILDDSRDILKWAVRERPEVFVDGGESEQSFLNAHAAFSIEGLTFGTAMLRWPLLKWVFPRLLAKACASLRRQQKDHPDLDEVFANKTAQNEARIRFFTQGSLKEKVETLSATAADLLARVPPPRGIYLYGDKPSAADVVLAVFLARLKMIGEWALVADRPDLMAWFDRISVTPAYQAADVWTVFSLKRVVRNR